MMWLKKVGVFGDKESEYDIQMTIVLAIMVTG